MATITLDIQLSGSSKLLSAESLNAITAALKAVNQAALETNKALAETEKLVRDISSQTRAFAGLGASLRTIGAQTEALAKEMRVLAASFRGINDAAAQAAGATKQQLTPEMSAAGSAAQAANDQFKKFSGTLQNSIPEALRFGTGQFRAFAGAASTIINGMQSGIQQAVGGFMSFFTTIGGGGLGGIFSGAATVVTSTIRGMVDFATSSANALAGVFGNAFDAIGDAATGLGKTFLGGFISSLGNIVPAVGEAFSALASVAGEAVSGVVSFAGAIASTIAESVGLALKGALVTSVFTAYKSISTAGQFEALKPSFAKTVGTQEQVKQGYGLEEMKRGNDKPMLEALASLRSATRGTIPDVELLANANRAAALGAAETSDDFAKLARSALNLARTMGIDAKFALESLTLGIGRQSRLILDNLGIMLKVSEVNEKYAASLGKSSAALTEEEKKRALILEVDRQAAKRLDGLDQSAQSASEAFSATGAAMSNMTIALGKQLLPLFQTVMGGVGKVLAITTEKVEQLVVKLQPYIKKAQEAIEPVIERIVDFMTNLTAEDIIKYAELAKKAVVQFVEDLPRIAQEAMVKFVKFIADSASTIGDGFYKVIKTSIEAGKWTYETFKPLADALADALSKAIEETIGMSPDGIITTGKFAIGASIAAQTGSAIVTARAADAAKVAATAAAAATAGAGAGTGAAAAGAAGAGAAGAGAAGSAAAGAAGAAGATGLRAILGTLGVWGLALTATVGGMSYLYDKYTDGVKELADAEEKSRKENIEKLKRLREKQARDEENAVKEAMQLTEEVAKRETAAKKKEEAAAAQKEAQRTTAIARKQSQLTEIQEKSAEAGFAEFLGNVVRGEPFGNIQSPLYKNISPNDVRTAVLESLEFHGLGATSEEQYVQFVKQMNPFYGRKRKKESFSKADEELTEADFEPADKDIYEKIDAAGIEIKGSFQRFVEKRDEFMTGVRKAIEFATGKTEEELTKFYGMTADDLIGAVFGTEISKLISEGKTNEEAVKTFVSDLSLIGKAESKTELEGEGASKTAKALLDRTRNELSEKVKDGERAYLAEVRKTEEAAKTRLKGMEEAIEYEYKIAEIDKKIADDKEQITLLMEQELENLRQRVEKETKETDRALQAQKVQSGGEVTSRATLLPIAKAGRILSKKQKDEDIEIQREAFGGLSAEEIASLGTAGINKRLADARERYYKVRGATKTASGEPLYGDFTKAFQKEEKIQGQLNAKLDELAKAEAAGKDYGKESLKQRKKEVAALQQKLKDAKKATEDAMGADPGALETSGGEAAKKYNERLRKKQAEDDEERIRKDADKKKDEADRVGAIEKRKAFDNFKKTVQTLGLTIADLLANWAEHDILKVQLRALQEAIKSRKPKDIERAVETVTPTLTGGTTTKSDSKVIDGELRVYDPKSGRYINTAEYAEKYGRMPDGSPIRTTMEYVAPLTGGTTPGLGSNYEFNGMVIGLLRQIRDCVCTCCPSPTGGSTPSFPPPTPPKPPEGGTTPGGNQMPGITPPLPPGGTTPGGQQQGGTTPPGAGINIEEYLRRLEEWQREHGRGGTTAPFPPTPRRDPEERKNLEWSDYEYPPSRFQPQGGTTPGGSSPPPAPAYPSAQDLFGTPNQGLRGGTTPAGGRSGYPSAQDLFGTQGQGLRGPIEETQRLVSNLMEEEQEARRSLATETASFGRGLETQLDILSDINDGLTEYARRSSQNQRNVVRSLDTTNKTIGRMIAVEEGLAGSIRGLSSDAANLYNRLGNLEVAVFRARGGFGAVDLLRVRSTGASIGAYAPTSGGGGGYYTAG